MRGIATQIAAVTLALIAAGIALVLALIALYLALASVTSPALATLGTSVAALVFAGLCLLIGRIAAAPGPRPERAVARKGAGDDQLAALVSAFANEELERVLAKNSPAAAAVALLAGLLVGFSPALRKALTDLLTK